MRLTVLFPLLAILPSVIAHGQVFSSKDRETVAVARAKYYNLQAAGFESMSCKVNFDFPTVPQLPSASDEATRKLIQQTIFTLKVEGKGPTVDHSYPANASDAEKQRASQTINLLTSFVAGTFQTWPTKGLQGPIPAFDSQIERVTSTANGYVFALKMPGSSVRVTTDSNYLVTEISSVGGKIVEHPIYAPSPDGLVFAGNEAIDDSETTGRVIVKYELTPNVVDGLRVPTSVRLKVNENIDVRFDLTDCTVKKGTVIHLGPPSQTIHLEPPNH